MELCVLPPGNTIASPTGPAASIVIALPTLRADGTVAESIQPENYRFTNTSEMLKAGFAKALGGPVTSP
jgi:hypothetical protein